MDRDLRNILLRDNPWLQDPDRLEPWFLSRMPETFVPRKVIAETGKRWQEPDRAHLVVGPRQAGKSTAIWAHLASVGRTALFIDCEQDLIQGWCRSAPLFLADLEEITPQPVTLFFEEAQHLDNSGLFLKGLVDRRVGVPILVTGSSSFHLGARVRESLAGRATRERLLPFSFREVCHDLDDLPGLARAGLIEQRFERHTVFGGYPDVWLGDHSEELLADLVEAIILRDASDFFRITRPDVFRRLSRLAATQVGNLVNLSEWASILGVSRDTVASYLEILEAGHVIVTVPPFVGGRRSELTRTPKLFFVDNGIRNQLVGSFQSAADRVDAGPALENWVFSELWKTVPRGTGIHFWRSTSKAEVDFVIDTGTRLVAVEVKAGALGRPSIPRSARSFIAAYEPETFVIVSSVSFDDDHIDQTRIKWISHTEIASTVSRLLG